MAISEERESFNKDNIGEQEKVSPPEEEKKDTSLFKGRSSVSQDAAESWAGKDKLYRTTKIPSSKRREILEKIAQNTGLRRDKVEEMYNDIKHRPGESSRKYRIERGDIEDTLDMLGKSLGMEE